MNSVLAQLKPLLLELQDLPGWPMTRIPAGLLLYDVLTALGATRTETEELLGREVPLLVDGPAVNDAARTPSAQVC